MKKVLALLAIAALTLPNLNAQEDQSVRFGIKLSPNMGWLRPDTKGVTSEGTKLGFTFGLMADFPLGISGNYAFASGLYLTNVGGGFLRDYTYVDGADLNSPEVTKSLLTDLRLRYIDVPLTIKMKTNEIGYMRYFGQVGFMPSFIIRAKADEEVAITDGDLNGTPIARGFQVNDNEDYLANTNFFRAALVVGAGVEYNFSGNTSLMAGITYNNGFTSVVKDITYEGKNAKVLNDFLELSIGVFF